MIQKTAFMRNWSSFFCHFPKYCVKILFGVFFYTKVGGENIFKLIIENESLHKNCNDNSVRIVNFAT